MQISIKSLSKKIGISERLLNERIRYWKITRVKKGQNCFISLEDSKFLNYKIFSNNNGQRTSFDKIESVVNALGVDLKIKEISKLSGISLSQTYLYTNQLKKDGCITLESKVNRFRY